MTAKFAIMTTAMQMLSGGSLLHQLVREMTMQLDRRFSSFGLTTQQAALLLTLSSGEASPRQLKEALGTDTAGMTKLVDRLAGKGLAQRRPHPGDRRSVLVAPTADGLALVPTLMPVFGEVATQLFAGFSDTEVADLESLLQRMRQNLQA